MMRKRMVVISKFLAYILRHHPSKFGLEIDKFGYAYVNDILAILEKKFRRFTKENLIELINQDSKGRFEILQDKIRATYGHSIPVELPNRAVKPPEILYHGTSRQSVEKILKEGLKPMERQFVHLSRHKEDAFIVGLRHTQKPIILKIFSREAYLEGVEFFKAANTFLARFIPKEYIKHCQD